MIIMEKEYCEDSLLDLQEDVFTVINELVQKGSIDENNEGFTEGRYTVQIVYKED